MGKAGGGGRRARVALAATVLALWLAGVAGVAVAGGSPHGTASPAAAVTHEGQSLAAPIVAMAAAGPSAWLVSGDGGVFTEGSSPFLGSLGGASLAAPIVGAAATPDAKGYWMVASDGGVFTFGDATFYGSTGGMPLHAPIVGMAPTHDGHGYWLVASDGGIFTFGDAPFLGSAGALPLARPVVGMAADPSTGGYWLVASDGGIFSFGAPFLGSTGTLSLAAPITGMSATPYGRGYRFVASDGGVFDFGDATYLGSAPQLGGVVAIAPSGSAGYWLAGAYGGVQSFGSASIFAALPVAGPSGGGGPFAFEETNADGSATRWNPCQPVPYVVNLDQAPAGALAMITSALTQVRAATGLRFSYVGTTHELASHERPLVSGGSWNPALFVWEQPGQSDFLPAGGGEDGMGGYTAVSNPSGKWVVVTGEVALDSAAGSLSGFGAAGGWEHLLLHEIGHMVGLAHVNDPAQVMYPIAGPGAAVAYGGGDLAGLAQLGSAPGCLTEPSTAGF